jgi:DNA-binding CsgD family transcriptional regulator
MLFGSKDILILVLSNELDILNYNAAFERVFKNRSELEALILQLKKSLGAEQNGFYFKQKSIFHFEICKYFDKLLSVDRLILLGKEDVPSRPQDLLSSGVGQLLPSVVNPNMSQEVFLSSLKNVVRGLPGSAHIKSIDGFKYLISNQGTINLFGFKSENDLFGKDDYQIACHMKHRWPNKLADEIRNYDLTILKHKKNLIGIKETPYLDAQGKVVVHYLNKMPVFFNDENPFAVLTIAFDISALKDISFLKNTYRRLYADPKQAHLKFLEHIQFAKGLSQDTVSSREFDCLELLAQGKSAKEIGLILNISSRTVETHIDNLKDKLGFLSKKQLLDYFYAIQTAIQMSSL